jgi:hypothetical protein
MRVHSSSFAPLSPSPPPSAPQQRSRSALANSPPHAAPAGWLPLQSAVPLRPVPPLSFAATLPNLPSSQSARDAPAGISPRRPSATPNAAARAQALASARQARSLLSPDRVEGFHNRMSSDNKSKPKSSRNQEDAKMQEEQYVERYVSCKVKLHRFPRE